MTMIKLTRFYIDNLTYIMFFAVLVISSAVIGFTVMALEDMKYRTV